MEPGARILSLRSALPTRACREVPRRRQSMRRGPAAWGGRAIFAVLVRVQNFQRSYLLLPTLTLVEKSSKVLPTVTYCDFGPPSLRFRLLIASAFASLSPAQRCGATRRRDKW